MGQELEWGREVGLFSVSQARACHCSGSDNHFLLWLMFRRASYILVHLSWCTQCRLFFKGLCSPEEHCAVTRLAFPFLKIR